MYGGGYGGTIVNGETAGTRESAQRCSAAPLQGLAESLDRCVPSSGSSDGRWLGGAGPLRAYLLG